MFTCLLRGRSTPEIRAMFYPCLCLCFEFSQITRTTPLRCTILHLSQIFFTDALTFIRLQFPCRRGCVRVPSVLLETIRNAPTSQIVGRQFHLDFVSRQNADEILPHLSRDMSQHLMLVLKLHPEH